MESETATPSSNQKVNGDQIENSPSSSSQSMQDGKSNEPVNGSCSTHPPAEFTVGLQGVGSDTSVAKAKSSLDAMSTDITADSPSCVPSDQNNCSEKQDTDLLLTKNDAPTKKGATEGNTDDPTIASQSSVCSDPSGDSLPKQPMSSVVVSESNAEQGSGDHIVFSEHSTESTETSPSVLVPCDKLSSTDASGSDATSQLQSSKIDKGSEKPTEENSSKISQLSENELNPPSTEVSAIAAAASSNSESIYYIKWVLFGQCKVPIVTQNENGPCPLLAVMNILLLKGKVKLAPMQEMVTSEQLMTYLGDCIFDNTPQNLTEITLANYEQNMQDAMGVMYKLQTGLDVNVKFTGVGDFEYTPECIIFDLLEISLYHGWLVDPQDTSTVEAITRFSYNQLVEKIISNKLSENEAEVTQALISEQFLNRTASQLTYHGLCELSSVVKEGEICVFFRNNHFNTLYKHNNELFILVTDQGFLTESNVVWEALSNVDGDCHFVDGSFRTYTKPLPSMDPIPNPIVPVGSPEQIDHDYQVALSLLEDTDPPPASAWETFKQEQMGSEQADLELALRLQQEENRRAMEEDQNMAASAAPASPSHGQGRSLGQGQQGQAQAPSPEGQRRARERVERKEKEGKDCSIL